MFNKEKIMAVERNIGYTFSDKSLLETALTHSSYSHLNGGENNEKLEFLGDSILNFIVAERLYFDRLTNEGAMTVVRAKLVSRTPLAKAVEKLKLLDYLRIDGGLTTSQLSVKARSNIFESVLAAIYLDSGIDQCRRFIFDNISTDSIYQVDYKSHLQEYLQSQRQSVKYIVKEIANGFEAEAISSDNEMGVGTGRRKKEAEQNAARQLCLKYKLI